MQFYPQRVFGIEWNNEFVNKLVEWDEEEHGEFELAYHSDVFIELLSEEYSIEAHIKSFEWVKGGYVQGLSGLDWGTTYLIVDEFHEDSIPLLEEKLGASFSVGTYSELG